MSTTAALLIVGGVFVGLCAWIFAMLHLGVRVGSEREE